MIPPWTLLIIFLNRFSSGIFYSKKSTEPSKLFQAFGHKHFKFEKNVLFIHHVKWQKAAITIVTLDNAKLFRVREFFSDITCAQKSLENGRL